VLSTVNIFGRAVRTDVDATRRTYATWNPHHCDCCYCRNVRAQWSTILSEDVRSAITSLGADPDKPGEIVDFGPNNKAGRLCEIEWPFIGAAHEKSSGDDPRTPRAKLVSVYSGGIPCGSEFAAESRWSASVMLEHVPWVLEEAEPAQ
jgi:hypothetical protein